MITATRLSLRDVIEEFYVSKDLNLDGSKTNELVISRPQVLEVEINDAIEKGLIPRPPATVLDLGSGNGTAAAVFASKGYQAYGIEIQAPLVQRAREHAARIQAPITFATGNYLMPVREQVKDDFHVILKDAPDPYKELGREFGSVGIIYCYPFPTQVTSLFKLFAQCGRKGQTLMLFGHENHWKCQEPPQFTHNIRAVLEHSRNSTQPAIHQNGGIPMFEKHPGIIRIGPESDTRLYVAYQKT